MMASSSSLDGFWPNILITVPNSLVLMSPPPSVSNMSKAALNSGLEKEKFKFRLFFFFWLLYCLSKAEIINFPLIFIHNTDCKKSTWKSLLELNLRLSLISSCRKKNTDLQSSPQSGRTGRHFGHQWALKRKMKKRWKCICSQASGCYKWYQIITRTSCKEWLLGRG